MTQDLHMLKQKNKKADNYSLKSSPMIKGKAVNLKEAISEITKILKDNDSLEKFIKDCENINSDKVKKGFDTGLFAKHPFIEGKKTSNFYSQFRS